MPPKKAPMRSPPSKELIYFSVRNEYVPAQIARPNGSVLYVPEEEIKYPMTAVTRFRNHGRTPAVVTRIAQSIAYFQAQPLEFPDKMATIPAGIVIGTGKVSRRWCS